MDFDDLDINDVPETDENLSDNIDNFDDDTESDDPNQEPYKSSNSSGGTETMMDRLHEKIFHNKSVHSFDISDDDLENLEEKQVAEEGKVEDDADHGPQVSFLGRKACPTRHGCSGATNCDYCGSDYPF